MNGRWFARAVVAAVGVLGGVVATSVFAPPLRAQGPYEQAQAAFQRNQVDSAYELIQRAAEAEPDRAAVQALLGDIACNKLQRAGPLSAFGLARTCKAAYGRAVQLAPDSVDYLERLASYLSQAPGIAGGDKDSARTLVEAVRRRDAVRGAFLRANLLWSGDAASKAEADSLVDAAGRARAGDRAVQLRMAGFWGGTNRPDRALAMYERMVAADAKDPVARFFLGRQLVVMKREPQRAREHLRFATAAPVPPGPYTYPAWGPWYRLGQAYVQLGMPDSARVCFEQALRVNPQFQQARASLDSLPRR